MTLKISAAATATLLHGWQPLFAQSGELISKPIPSSGELLPVIGIGARNYRLGEGWAIDTTGFIETLRLFHQQGGRLVDTSPNYGNSESIVGNLLSELGIRNDLFLATKVDREDRQSAISRMEGSLKRMHTDHFQLMQIHTRDTGLLLATWVPYLYPGCGFSARRFIWDARRRARAAAWLPPQDWETLLQKPLDVVRGRLKLGRPPAYAPIYVR